MPSFELSKLQAVTGPRALSDTDRAGARPLGGVGAATNGSPSPANGVSIEVNSTLDASTPPINNERVQEIKDALKNGSYPLVPTEIADAMIAAQLSFGIE